MLMSLAQQGNFFLTWFVLTVLACVLTLTMSGALFRIYYWAPTFEQWRFKSNPKYPKPSMVRREVLQMLKGIVMATLPPTIALHLVDSGWSKAYAGLGGYGWGYFLFTVVAVYLASDFIEWGYHYIGHSFKTAWSQHKHHHVFFNPSPFAVIADDYVDQFLRASPMLIIPLFMPVNMDMLFVTYGALFYGYGVYLHFGYETRWPNAHHPVLNTAFQHYVHHAKSTLHKPMHTGFTLKVWDNLVGSTYDAGPDACLCATCCQARGERTVEAWEAVDKPDYGELLQPRFWLKGPGKPAAGSDKVDARAAK
jgi:lathosterol oxidase